MHVLFANMHVYFVTCIVMITNFTDSEFIDKIKDENVVGAFTYLFNKLGDLFATENFDKFRNVCMLRGAPLPREFKEQVKAAQELSDILDVFDNRLYCNWLNVRLLKRIAKNIDNKRAVELIKIYEDHVYSRKVSDVKKYFPICFDEKVVSLIKVKINISYKKHPNPTIKQFFAYCEELENIMDIYTGGGSVVDSSAGCLLLTMIIPLHCSLHAFNMAKKNFLILRRFNIQYLEIESFPKVFAFNHSGSESIFENLSLNNIKCMYVSLTRICTYVDYVDAYICTYVHTYIHTYTSI